MKNFKLFPLFVALLAMSSITTAQEQHSVLMKSVNGNYVTAISSTESNQFVVPEQEIVGDEDTIPLGELVNLTVSKIQQHPKHHVSCAYTWTLIDLSTGENKTFVTMDGGVFFGAGIQPKKIKAICAVTHVYIVPGDGKGTFKELVTKTKLLESDVNIGGSAPIPPGPTPPGPGPGPAPTPAPDLPDGKYGLAKTVFGLADTYAPATTKQQGAQALATSMRGIASSIAAGVRKTPEEVLQSTATSNRSALTTAGIQPATWEPFAQQLQNVLFSLYESEKLNALSDYQTAWNEIADGLEAVK